MISLEIWHILTHLQKLPKNVGDLGKLIVAKGFKKLPKVQQIARSGLTDYLSRYSLICVETSPFCFKSVSVVLKLTRALPY